jgi:hypothetical protein
MLKLLYSSRTLFFTFSRHEAKGRRKEVVNPIEVQQRHIIAVRFVGCINEHKVRKAPHELDLVLRREN